jgi:hypothetical protein
MGNTLKVIILFFGLAFIGTVMYLLVKRKINERNSLFWLTGALIILALSTIPEILEVMAKLAGVYYPPTLLFLMAILIVLFILLSQSVQISLLQDKVRELTQLYAILNTHESLFNTVQLKKEGKKSKEAI